MPMVVPYQRPLVRSVHPGVIIKFNEKSNFVFVIYVHQVFLSIEHDIKVSMKCGTTVIEWLTHANGHFLQALEEVPTLLIRPSGDIKVVNIEENYL